MVITSSLDASLSAAVVPFPNGPPPCSAAFNDMVFLSAPLCSPPDFMLLLFATGFPDLT